MTGIFSLVAAQAAARKKSDAGQSTPTFEAVYAAHFTFVWRTLRGLGVSDAAIDDAAQEVFLVVYRKLNQLTAPEGIKAWMFSIARRVASDHRRSLKRKGVPVEYNDCATPGDGTTPLRHTENRELLAQVERFMTQLSDENRSIFVLSEIEQLPVSQVSEMIGMNANTVYSRRKVIRRDLELFMAQKRPKRKQAENE